jgi:hypothetical protein
MQFVPRSLQCRAEAGYSCDGRPGTPSGTLSSSCRHSAHWFQYRERYAESSAGIGLFVRCHQRLLYYAPVPQELENYGPPTFEVGGFVHLAGSVVENPHGLHWKTPNSSANARLIMARNVISRPQIGQMTSFCRGTFSLICIIRCYGSFGHDADQSRSGQVPPYRE